MTLILELGYVIVVFGNLGSMKSLLLYTRGSYIVQNRDAIFLAAPVMIIGVAIGVVGGVWWFFGWQNFGLEMALIGAVVTSLSIGQARLFAAATSEPTRLPISSYLSQFLVLAGIILLAVREEKDFVSWILVYFFAGLVFYFPHRTRCSPAVPLVVNESRERRRSLRAKGFPLVLGDLGNVLVNRADRLLVGVLLGLDQLGIYILLVVFFEIFLAPIETWLQVKSYKWSQLSREERNSFLNLLPGRYFLLALPVVSLIAISSFLFQEFSSGTPDFPVVLVTAVLGVAYLLKGFARVGNYLLISFGRPAVASQGLLIGGVSLGVFILILGVPFGLLGVALSQLFVALGLSCWNVWWLRRPKPEAEASG